MEGCHIAHDDIVGNDVIIGNCSKLAGEVTVDDHAILSACVLVHQFCRIGSYTMVGGGTRSSQSIVPYSICAREPASYCGLNIVGLRRRGFERDVINTIHEAYRIIFQGGLSLTDALATIQRELPQTDEIRYILDFIEDTKKRGFVH
jgi:UDP-N-acetylglucosamine acyltransferase